MELECGMYVRTKDGKIAKFIKYDEKDKNELVTDYYKYSTIWIKDIVKASFDIIDILEVEDYVNGYLVTFVYKPDGDKVFRIELERDTLKGHIISNSSQIKSIVTHEQMEQMSYKVGE